jgi:hypothetical protein
VPKGGWQGRELFEEIGAKRMTTTTTRGTFLQKKVKKGGTYYELFEAIGAKRRGAG